MGQGLPLLVASSLPALWVSELAPGIFLSILTAVVTVLLAKTSRQAQDSVFLSHIQCLFITYIAYLNCRNHLASRNSELYLSKLVRPPAPFSPQPAASPALPREPRSLELSAVVAVECLPGTRVPPRLFLCSFLYSFNIVLQWGIFLKIFFLFLFLFDL